MLHATDADAPAGKVAADSVEILHDELHSLDRAGLAQRQALADHNRAGRAGWRHLDHTHVLVRAYVVVQVETDLPGVEVLGGVHVANRDWNDLKFHVHEAPR